MATKRKKPGSSKMVAKKSAVRARTAKAIPPDTPRAKDVEEELTAEVVTEAETAPAIRALKIAGVGASAGGLDAFRDLLRALPARPGLAIVLIQHLAPTYESILPEILSKSSPVPVQQVTNGMPVELDHIYVIPPNVDIELTDGHFSTSPRDHGALHLPIDVFFRSLARHVQGDAIGVVLSGTSSDGALGVREIKAAGGIVLAQVPETASYDGMPRAALATNCVDLALSPADIARELVRIAAHPLSPIIGPRREGDEVVAPDRELATLYQMLRNATGVDFTHYKMPTIQRRLQRRMVLHRLVKLGDYIRLLRQQPEELKKLYQDLLIHVTRFFRDPESFEILMQAAYPKIVEKLPADVPIRVWVAGSSTGEEAYSVAMSLLEFLANSESSRSIQIFATDISETAIDQARAGIYPENIAADVSAERLRRFFNKTDGGYRVTQAVRELCVFARQDITRDPPFSKLDLILCRNVLIYLSPPLQRRLMGVFHYALKPSGFLMLGEVETVGASSDLFALADKRHKLYTRKHSDTPSRLDFALRIPETPLPHARESASAQAESLLQQRANRLLLDRYGPAGVLVNDDLQIVYARGQTGRYLELPHGSATLDVLRMAREGLGLALRTALQTARKSGTPSLRRNLRIRYGSETLRVHLAVTPIREPNLGPHYLVVFEEGALSATPETESPQPRASRAGRGKAKGKGAGNRGSRQMAELERELQLGREHMQSIIQDLEAANEELQSANEEILSSNEELQSTNEELDTAREELQSTNEEINTVNEELHARNEELIRANSDMSNLLASVQIAIVIVSNDMLIRRFTPMAERVLNLIPTDVGRPIGHIKPNIDCPDLEQRIIEVVESVAPFECQVRDPQGNWYALRIRPYKNLDNRIDGAVLALFDIDSSVRRASELEELRGLFDVILHMTHDPLVLLDDDLRVIRVNRAFNELSQVTAVDTQGTPFLEIADGLWDGPELRSFLEDRLRRASRTDTVMVQREIPGLGARTFRVSGRRLSGGTGQDVYVLCFVAGDAAHENA
jgi:two-component system, chemotaxis family, CheB/CheR fusion protein